MAPAVLWVRWRFSVMKISGIKIFLNCYVQKRFAMEFICALWKWHQCCNLFYFSYYVITAEWLFSTITNRCFYCERLINFPFTLYASSTRSFLDKSNINRGKPCSAEWLLRTITKCCYQVYSLPIRLRANAICLKGKTMFKHRILILT